LATLGKHVRPIYRAKLVSETAFYRRSEKWWFDYFGRDEPLIEVLGQRAVKLMPFLVAELVSSDGGAFARSAGRFRRRSSLRARAMSSITSTKRIRPPQLEHWSGSMSKVQRKSKAICWGSASIK
jgi:hypothetical protein